MGRPIQAQRWAEAIDRWQDGAAEAWAAFVRAMFCRDGAAQMRADADETVRMFRAQHIVHPGPLVWQRLARMVCGDLDGADQSLQDAVSVGEQAGAREAVAVALPERSLLTMARNQWDRAEILAGQADAIVRRNGLEEPVACLVLARTALHRGDLPAVRHHLVDAQRLRPMVTTRCPSWPFRSGSSSPGSISP